MKSAKQTLARVAKSAAGGLGFELRRKGEPDSDVKLKYIDALRTIAEAKAAGLNVPEHLRRKEGYGDAIKGYVERIADLGVSPPPGGHVVEIGTGTGRVAVDVKARFSPATYESYETDPAWAKYVEDELGLLSRTCDGRSLAETSDAVADLTCAFGVFVYLPFLVAVGYWRECLRVTTPGGWIVFDAITDPCFDADNLALWEASPDRFPTFTGRDWLIAFMASLGAVFVGSYVRTYGPGHSEMLAFRKAG